MKKSAHPDATMLTDPIDYDAAFEKCERYLKDFPKIVQHEASYVNLVRAHLAMRQEIEKLNDEVLRLMKVEARLNTVPKPASGPVKEKIAVKIDFSCTQGGEEPTPSFRFIDANSGVMIMDVRMSYESFGQLMTGLGHRPAEARVYDSYKIVGLYNEVKTVKLPRPKTWDREKVKVEIAALIAEHCAVDLENGWFVSYDGTSTQQNDADCWKVTLARYTRTKPESKKSLEDL